MKRSRDRAKACWAESATMVGAIVGFVALFVAAARAYPGGTHFDRRAAGHDFWRNTLCDVARTVALDGRANQSACELARAAMIILALGIGALFLSLPRLFASHPSLGVRVRALGALTVPAAIAVVLLPTDRFGQLHGLAIVAAGALGLSATFAALRGLLLAPRAPRLVVGLGVLTLAVAGVDFALYVRELVSGGGAQLAVAVLERLATILLLLWMFTVARAIMTEPDLAHRRS
jgi:hypothetical protein